MTDKVEQYFIVTLDMLRKTQDGRIATRSFSGVLSEAELRSGPPNKITQVLDGFKDIPWSEPDAVPTTLGESLHICSAMVADLGVIKSLRDDDISEPTGHA